MKKKVRSAAGRVLVTLGMTLAGLAVWTLAPAQAAESTAAKPDATASASGEVRRINEAAGKIAIKHDAISALELPAMTLVYQIDVVLLVDIKPGDQVRFTAARQNNKYVITAISK